MRCVGDRGCSNEPGGEAGDRSVTGHRSASGGQLRHDSNPSGYPIIQGLSFDPFLPAASFSSAVSRFASERVRSRLPAHFDLTSLRR